MGNLLPLNGTAVLHTAGPRKIPRACWTRMKTVLRWVGGAALFLQCSTAPVGNVQEVSGAMRTKTAPSALTLTRSLKLPILSCHLAKVVAAVGRTRQRGQPQEVQRKKLEQSTLHPRSTQTGRSSARGMPLDAPHLAHLLPAL
jgi:hypothetical protein